jgi:ABC-type dipeptide/oligopeptide/nickel transport system permease subunit
MNKLSNFVTFLKIEHLEGGGYDVNSVLKAIKTLTNWALSIGIAAAGVSLVVGFILYAVSDVDKKAHVKTRIIQTLLGIAGIVLAISLVNLIIDLF